MVRARRLDDRQLETAAGDLAALGELGDDREAHRVAQRVQHGGELKLGGLGMRERIDRVPAPATPTPTPGHAGNDRIRRLDDARTIPTTALIFPPR